MLIPSENKSYSENKNTYKEIPSITEEGLLKYSNSSLEESLKKGIIFIGRTGTNTYSFYTADAKYYSLYEKGDGIDAIKNEDFLDIENEEIFNRFKFIKNLINARQDLDDFKYNTQKLPDKFIKVVSRDDRDKVIEELEKNLAVENIKEALKDRQSIDSFRGDFFFLSNFYPAKINYENILYPTSEHAYQASKTLNQLERVRVSQFSKTQDAKDWGTNISSELKRPDRDDIKLNVMEEIVRTKFSQNESLKNRLLTTQNVPLIEGNTHGDDFWGVVDGKGENNLGKILMKIREELNNKQLLNPGKI